MAKESFELGVFARGRARGHGQGLRSAPQALAEEVHGRAPLLAAG
jgi:hypothetical protein